LLKGQSADCQKPALVVRILEPLLCDYVHDQHVNSRQRQDSNHRYGSTKYLDVLSSICGEYLQPCRRIWLRQHRLIRFGMRIWTEGHPDNAQGSCSDALPGKPCALLQRQIRNALASVPGRRDESAPENGKASKRHDAGRPSDRVNKQSDWLTGVYPRTKTTPSAPRLPAIPSSN